MNLAFPAHIHKSTLVSGIPTKITNHALLTAMQGFTSWQLQTFSKLLPWTNPKIFWIPWSGSYSHNNGPTPSTNFLYYSLSHPWGKNDWHLQGLFWLTAILWSVASKVEDRAEESCFTSESGSRAELGKIYPSSDPSPLTKAHLPTEHLVNKHSVDQFTYEYRTSRSGYTPEAPSQNLWEF